MRAGQVASCAGRPTGPSAPAARRHVAGPSRTRTFRGSRRLRRWSYESTCWSHQTTGQTELWGGHSSRGMEGPARAAPVCRLVKDSRTQTPPSLPVLKGWELPTVRGGVVPPSWVRGLRGGGKGSDRGSQRYGSTTCALPWRPPRSGGDGAAPFSFPLQSLFQARGELVSCPRPPRSGPRETSATGDPRAQPGAGPGPPRSLRPSGVAPSPRPSWRDWDIL